MKVAESGRGVQARKRVSSRVEFSELVVSESVSLWAVLAGGRVARLAARSGHLGDVVHEVRGTLGLPVVIGECVLNSRLDLGVALVVGEARRCYLIVISV